MSEVSRNRWANEFREWFREVIFKAGVYDYRYPIKGVGVWPPYGAKIRRNVVSIIRKLLDETGHDEVLFPLLIPEEILKKESEHIAKFESEVYWVTQGGSERLERKLALRPTSETAIMEMLKLWVKAHTDLPIRIYQIVSVFRYETKATQPMIRVREVTTFKEAHTAHATMKEAEEQVQVAVKVYKEFFDEICVPYMISRRPEWDKFAGAVYTIAFDTLMPDGRTLQIGTVHNLGQNFSRAFDVKYLKPDGTHEYVYTTSYGISERAIAALISIHGDDHGLVLPPNIAPIQVVIVAIPYKGHEAAVYSNCRDLFEELKEAGIRAFLDDREDITPGEKFYYWELKGVPVRVEIGPKDISQGVITVSRRDTLERMRVKREKSVEYISQLLMRIKHDLRERARKWLKGKEHEVNEINEARNIISQGLGVALVPWCGDDECGQELEELIEGSILGIPMDEHIECKGKKCINCGRKAETYVRLARTY
ncbi:MAG: proline--tRNA ligase [Thermoprotei archaeon]|nr:proline--tRNA ligase [Thermoprotei archaeon]